MIRGGNRMPTSPKSQLSITASRFVSGNRKKPTARDGNGMPDNDRIIFEALRHFAGSVSLKTRGITPGQPEDQLRAPLETLLAVAGRAFGLEVVAKGESLLPGRLGRPDYAVLVGGALAGFVELKEPGKGAEPSRYTGHDREQWNRFRALPNLLYSDGNEWSLFESGERIGQIVKICGDVVTDGERAVTQLDADALSPLLLHFLSWDPIVPQGARELAAYLAPMCRLLRQEVADALTDSSSPLIDLAKDWRQLLFPEADDERFADAYAQTVTFALLLARSEGASTLDVDTAIRALAAHHTLLSRALDVLTDPNARKEIAPALRLLQRVIDRVPNLAMARDNRTDPWLYFYEDFLAVYDPQMRKDAGVYYTPVEVVHAQIRLLDRLLVDRLDKTLGFADSSVVTLDPAVGTGTYLLGVVEHALRRVADEQGPGAIPGTATSLSSNLHGFEFMVGPYSVAELRLSRAILDCGAILPDDGVRVYLTDTMESPFAAPPDLPLFMRPISDQRKKALVVKEKVSVLVCLGNPPYDRHKAAKPRSKASRAVTGGWVRWGDPRDKGRLPIFDDFSKPASEAGFGVDVKNLYNLYVYFWRWALWKVFEHAGGTGPGIISFISASSFLGGNAFVGMREHMRKLCDAIWVIDLGGEGRGTRQTENVFAIQTPVAITIAARWSDPDPKTPATVRYCLLEGTREEKLRRLDSIQDFADLEWVQCPDGWQTPFSPSGAGTFFTWPLLTDLMPWQHTGVEFMRTWPIAHDPDILARRWHGLLTARSRVQAFRESRDRKIDRSYLPLLQDQEKGPPIAQLPVTESIPKVERLSFRSFDRQWVIADSRLGDTLKPVLWRTRSEKQIFFTSLFNHVIGDGPTMTVCADVPDRHHYRGSYGGKDVLPLYRDPESTSPNVMPGLFKILGQFHNSNSNPEEFASYIYGVLAQPSYAARFHDELVNLQIRVPITKSVDLYRRMADAGARLIWLHTYGQRSLGFERPNGQVPRGIARSITPIPETHEGYPKNFNFNADAKEITVGDGSFGPVAPFIWEFQVSGLKVVQSWLKYRMLGGAGKTTSPLDKVRPQRWTMQMTTEFLEMLWVLEASVSSYPRLAALLDEILAGPLVDASELPAVAHTSHDPPRMGDIAEELFE